MMVWSKMYFYLGSGSWPDNFQFFSSFAKYICLYTELLLITNLMLSPKLQKLHPFMNSLLKLESLFYTYISEVFAAYCNFVYYKF